MELPLLLAGPILRRVDPTLAAVWLALSKEATVTLRVWEGQLTSRAAGETAAPFVESDPELTWRLGEELHLILISARIPPQAGKSFRPDTTYCYDLSIKVGDVQKPFTLKTLGMLDVASPENAGDGIEHVALGYEPDLLPSFAPPPSELTDLHVIYGSCRRPAHQDPDAMVWIDDYLLDQRRYKDPRARPHQLFLGGDQIYADDVHTLHMLMLMDLGQQLIGREPQPPHGPLEQIDTGRTVDRQQAGTTLPPIPREAYGGTDEDIARQPVPPQSRLPADREHFPEGQRKDLTLRSAQFTSTDGSSHLISIGEFAAMYLSVWSNAVWPREIPLARLQPDPGNPFTLPLTWTSKVSSTMTIKLPELAAAAKVPLHLYRLPETDKEKQAKTPDDIKKEQRKAQRSLRLNLGVHRDFLAGLARVRRVLANVPTYMILDDHDVTDDFFLNPVWRERVLTTNLGQTILRNAMLTYALFQDWGNDPVRYDSGHRAELLTLATSLFPPGQSGPEQSACDRLDELFGHDLRNELNQAGQYDGVNPPITWSGAITNSTSRPAGSGGFGIRSSWAAGDTLPGGPRSLT